MEARTRMLPRSFCCRKGWKEPAKWILDEWSVEVTLAPDEWETVGKELDEYFGRLQEARETLAHGSPPERLEWARQVVDERRADFHAPPS
ncbi:MAG: hypothetical protein LBT65_08160 [Synergistaceae bacterium]|jgi:hypothetical protein|nr:hypothetical protein [Synergistaceae bacterium]